MVLSRSKSIASLLVAFFLAAAASGTTAQSLQVLVLDAVSAKPQPDVEVFYFCSGPPLNGPHLKTLTDGNGSASFNNPCEMREGHGDQHLEVSVLSRADKENCAADGFTLKQLLGTGYVAVPTGETDGFGSLSCPAKIARKLRSTPGQLILFIKKPTWLQKHIIGLQ